MEEQISNQQAFSEKVVWITGASGGIGEEMAVAFAESGSKVVLSARNEQQLEPRRWLRCIRIFRSACTRTTATTRPPA